MSAISPTRAELTRAGFPEPDDWRSELDPPPPWTTADRRRAHRELARRGVQVHDGWLATTQDDARLLAAGPRARDALRLACALGAGNRVAWPATRAELRGALASGSLSAAAMGVGADGAWWEEQP